MNEDESSLNSIGELQAEVNAKIGYLLDNNARAVVILRNEAKAFEEVAKFYANCVTTAIEISGMVAELALSTSQITGDIIVAEFGDEDGHDNKDDDDDDD